MKFLPSSYLNWEYRSLFSVRREISIIENACYTFWGLERFLRSGWNIGVFISLDLSHKFKSLCDTLYFILVKLFSYLHIFNISLHLIPFDLIYHVIVVPFLYYFMLEFLSLSKCLLFGFQSLKVQFLLIFKSSLMSFNILFFWLLFQNYCFFFNLLQLKFFLLLLLKKLISFLHSLN